VGQLNIMTMKGCLWSSDAFQIALPSLLLLSMMMCLATTLIGSAEAQLLGVLRNGNTNSQIKPAIAPATGRPIKVGNGELCFNVVDCIGL
jgi:hypothetical protein